MTHTQSKPLRHNRVALALTCSLLTLIPGLALADGRGAFHRSTPVQGSHRGGGHDHGYRGHSDGNRHQGGSYRGGAGHRGGVSIHLPGPRYRPNFGIHVFGSRPAHYYRSPRVVVRFGAPAWRTGAWYHGWRAGQIGWWWGINNVWYSYVAPVYPYPVTAPLVAAPVEEAPVNYYCQSLGEYYPQLQECPEQWQVIAAQPVAPPQ